MIVNYFFFYSNILITSSPIYNQQTMGNNQQLPSSPSTEFSFQPLLSYRFAKTIPTTLIPAKQLKQLLPWLDWSLTNIQHISQKSEWDFLTIDWSLKRRWKVLLFSSSDHYQQGVYDQTLQTVQKSIFKQIDKDVKRTYPLNNYFDDDQNIGKFSRILKNIANYFPDSGYTQGINFIVGFLLQCGFSEQQTFWLFIHMSLNGNIFMMGYYEDQFPMTNLAHDLFMLLLKQYYPKLAENIVRMVLPKEIWIFQWFLTFYLNSFPVDVCKIFWDYILVSPEPFAIVYLALGIIDQVYHHLIKLKEDNDFGLFFQKLKTKEFFIKNVNLNKLFLKAKQLTLAPSLLSAAINKISQIKGYNNFYTRYYSLYDSPEKSEIIYEKYLRQVKKQRLLFKVNHNRSNVVRSSKILNPIEFYMTESVVVHSKDENIPCLVLLKHIREEQSKLTNRLTESNVNEENSTEGYYFKYPKIENKNIETK